MKTVSHLSSTPHSRLDDVESMFHVLQWVVLRYVKHGMSEDVLGGILCDTFDKAVDMGGGQVRCSGRYVAISESIWKESSGLNKVLKGVLEDIRQVIHARYEPIGWMKEAQNVYQLYMKHCEGSTLSQADLEQLKRNAMPAILLNNLNNPKWFTDLLRDAANDPQCPIDDISIPQKFIRHPSAKDATSQICVNTECYSASGEPARKRQKRAVAPHTIISSGTYGDDISDEDGVSDAEDRRDRMDKTYRPGGGKRKKN